MKLQQAKFATIAMDHSSFVRSQGTAFAGSSSGSSRGRDHADSPSALACAASAHPFGPFLLAKNGLFPAVVQPMLLGKHTPNRIHGAAILMVCHGSHQYTRHVSIYIPAPWILWVHENKLYLTARKQTSRIQSYRQENIVKIRETV